MGSPHQRNGCYDKILIVEALMEVAYEIGGFYVLYHVGGGDRFML